MTTPAEDLHYFTNSRKEMLPFIPISCKRILEIGCAEGNFGSLLKKNINAEVWGIEVDPIAASHANQKLDRVITGTVESSFQLLQAKKFDCIVCNDVLEHLVDPFSTLLSLKELIHNDGFIVGSIPNIRYFPVLADLVLHGDWRYGESGVLDKTHLRFFTYKSIKRTFSDCGYQLLQLKGINPTTSIKWKIANIFTIGRLSDSRFLQFAFVAGPQRSAQN